jgi:hypothetical protein
MRLLAERLLEDVAGCTYVDGELISHKLKALLPPKDKHKYHICCSEHNPGALALMQELSEKRGFTLQQLSQALPESASSAPHQHGVGMGGFLRAKRTESKGYMENTLLVTTNAHRVADCDHMLLYLTSLTWTRGDMSKALAVEVGHAMDLGVHVMLAHESERSPRSQCPCRQHLSYAPRSSSACVFGCLMRTVPGAGEQEARLGCEFGSFFSCADGATPAELLKRGIYSEIAIALKGGPWREASMAMLGMAFGLSKEEAEAQSAGQDVLGKGLSLVEGSISSSVLKIRGDLGGPDKIGRLSKCLDAIRERLMKANSKRPQASVNTVSVTADTYTCEVEADEAGLGAGRIE